jgi:hypothetical protein
MKVGRFEGLRLTTNLDDVNAPFVVEQLVQQLSFAICTRLG